MPTRVFRNFLIFAAALALLALAACGGTAPTASEQPAVDQSPIPPSPLLPTSQSPAATSPFTSTLPVITNQSPAAYYLSVTFDAQRAEQLDIARYAGVPAEGYWTPSAAGVQDLEAALPAYLQGPDGQPYPNLVSRLPEYTRQYAGITSGGRRLIFANFFCRDLGIDWQQEYVDVLDGGDCFFRLLYDVESGAFSGLSVNGEA